MLGSGYAVPQCQEQHVPSTRIPNNPTNHENATSCLNILQRRCEPHNSHNANGWAPYEKHVALRVYRERCHESDHRSREGLFSHKLCTCSWYLRGVVCNDRTNPRLQAKRCGFLQFSATFNTITYVFMGARIDAKKQLRCASNQGATRFKHKNSKFNSFYVPTPHATKVHPPLIIFLSRLHMQSTHGRGLQDNPSGLRTSSHQATYQNTILTRHQELS